MDGENAYHVKGDVVFLTVSNLKKEGAKYIQSTELPVFNFADVNKTDSSAIALMLAWRRIAKDNQKSIRFEHLPQQLIDVAETYGVKDLI